MPITSNMPIVYIATAERPLREVNDRKLWMKSDGTTIRLSQSAKGINMSCVCLVSQKCEDKPGCKVSQVGFPGEQTDSDQCTWKDLSGA